jgi:hypothetical protein
MSSFFQVLVQMLVESGNGMMIMDQIVTEVNYSFLNKSTIITTAIKALNWVYSDLAIHVVSSGYFILVRAPIILGEIRHRQECIWW